MARPLSTDLPLSPELRNIFTRARDTARTEGQELRSAHLLISMCHEPNEASSFLESSEVRLQSVLALETGSRGEPARALTSMVARAERLARSSGSRSVSSMHLLAALLREPQSEAYRLLEAGGINLSGVRTNAMAIATGRAPASHVANPVARDTASARDTPSQGIPLHPELSLLDLRSGKPSSRAARRARARALLEERSSPVHPALRDAYLRTTPSEGLPALSREAVVRDARAREAADRIAPPPPPQRPPASVLTRALRTWPPPSSAHVTYDRPPAVPVPDTDASSLAQDTSELLPTPKPMTLRDRFAARKRAARQRRQNAESRPQTSEHVSLSHPAILRRPSPEDLPHEVDDACSTDEFSRQVSERVRALARAPHEAPSEAPVAEPEALAEGGLHAEEAILDAEQTTRSLAMRLFGDTKTPTTPPPSSPATAVNEPAPPTEDARTSNPEAEVSDTSPDAPVKKAPDRPDPALAARYRLDPSTYPMLSKFGRNLTEEAAMGRIDAVIGRDLETTRLRDVLGKRRGNNPLLVGDPGVGKTAIVEGLARHFCDMARRGDRMGERTIIELELGRLISGTHLRGSFSERLIGLKDEVRAADGDVIVFLDELHAWIGAGQSGDGGDAAGELKTALARGHFPCIGATTRDEFTQYIESDPAFQRRFAVVDVEEPSVDTAIVIAQGVRAHYERHHRITYADAAIDAAVRLSQRYLHERRLPDKALNVLDLAGSRAARTGRRWVGREDVAGVVADMAGLPADRLTRTDRARFLDVERHISEHVIGHGHVISAVAEVLRRNYAGFRSQRPIGSLLFLGPTGVGKTELVKALADFLFHDRDAIVRLDMSEFMESHSVSRMIGSPPGYVGYEAGGQLTEAVRRRPYQIVLLDEIEKAHPDILNLLLQLLDEGRLTDGKGRAVDFSNTVVIMTSNLGSSAFDRVMREEAHAPRIGFGKEPGSNPERDRALLTRQVIQSAQSHFAPELWNRIDERLVFMPLSRHEVASISRLQLIDSARRLAEESDIEVTFDDTLITHLIQNGGYDKRFGARPMRQTISRLVEGSLATLILSGELRPGGSVHASASNGQILFDVR